jgi:hypothetical protein
MTAARARRSTRRRAVLVAAVAAPAALAALPALAAAAPTIATSAICLRPSQEAGGTQISPRLDVTGSGFSPNSLIALTRGAQSITTYSDAAGNLAYSFSVFDLLSSRAPRATPLDVLASDPVLGPSNALRVKAAPLTFSATPKRTKPSKTVTFRFSGFTPDRPIYAHYRFKGRLRATARMGLASNPCGLLTARRDQIPVPDPGLGLWRVPFSQSKRFAAKAVPRIDATVNVFSTPG